MEGYRKTKGWSGKIYYVKMTKAEIIARRRLGMLACLVSMPVMVFIMALAAGMIG